LRNTRTRATLSLSNSVCPKFDLFITLIFKKFIIVLTNMSSGPNGTGGSTLHDEDEPKICKYTGQLIVEKQPKFLGLSLMSIILISVSLTSFTIGAMVLYSDDEKVRR
jgi:hypothetical protein